MLWYEMQCIWGAQGLYQETTSVILHFMQRRCINNASGNRHNVTIYLDFRQALLRLDTLDQSSVDTRHVHQRPRPF